MIGAPSVGRSVCMSRFLIGEKKKETAILAASQPKLVLLLLDDSCGWADIGTGAAIDANICINYIDIAF